jgi:hypothetical protein
MMRPVYRLKEKRRSGLVHKGATADRKSEKKA